MLSSIVVLLVLLYSETKMTVLKYIHVYYTSFIYSKIIYIQWTFNFMGKAIHDFKIPTKYFFTLVMLHTI